MFEQEWVGACERLQGQFLQRHVLVVRNQLNEGRDCLERYWHRCERKSLTLVTRERARFPVAAVAHVMS